MYYFYLGETRFPVAPAKMQMKIASGNSTINLINEGEVNQLKSPKLTQISFEVTLPAQNYPFASYVDGFLPPVYFLETLEEIAVSGEPTSFKVIRTNPRGEALFDTNMQVSLEDYTITEDAEEGMDVKVSIELKKYVPYGTHKIKIKKKKNGKKSVKKSKSKRKSKKLPTTYTVKSGDTLALIAQKYYKSMAKKSLIYKKNKTVIEAAAKAQGKSGSGNGKILVAGTKLQLPKGG